MKTKVKKQKWETEKSYLERVEKEKKLKPLKVKMMKILTF